MKTGQARAEWGEYAPTGVAKWVLRLCSALPASHRIFYSLTKAFRTRMRRGPIRFYDVEAHGLRLRLINRGNYCDTTLLFSPQFYDRQELDWLYHELAQGGTFVDVGGNIGAYSLILARRLGRRVSVHAVEPEADLCERMLFNARSNRLDITLHRTALSDYEGDGYIVLSAKQSGENTFVSDADAHGTSVRVPVTTLLKLCRNAGIREIAALKIDVEGHEPAILSAFFEEAERTLWPRAMVVERNGHQSAVINRLIERLPYTPILATARNILLKR